MREQLRALINKHGFSAINSELVWLAAEHISPLVLGCEIMSEKSAPLARLLYTLDNALQREKVE